ncbi:MAG: hypothetical protein C4554_02010 [Dethiobacter sp.]|jgi:hypothetical protein|nr:MAG: hypothetical protein C4554_02010 [Dethiobacter sp.]
MRSNYFYFLLLSIIIIYTNIVYVKPAFRNLTLHSTPYNNFHLIDVESLRMHYAMTTDRWARNFEQVADQVEKNTGKSLCVCGVYIWWDVLLIGEKGKIGMDQEYLYQRVVNQTRGEPRCSERPTSRSVGP